MANKKEQEDNKPIKTGVLAKDVYDMFPAEDLFFDGVMSVEEFEATLKKYTSSLRKDKEIFIPKGTEFSCYLEYGEEFWYFGDHCLNANEAKTLLENIKSVK